MKKTIKIAVAVSVAIAGFCLIQIIKANDLRTYAEAHNCTWHATGSMYGDDRDYICK